MISFHHVLLDDREISIEDLLDVQEELVLNILDEDPVERGLDVTIPANEQSHAQEDDFLPDLVIGGLV